MDSPCKTCILKANFYLSRSLILRRVIVERKRRAEGKYFVLFTPTTILFHRYLHHPLARISYRHPTKAHLANRIMLNVTSMAAISPGMSSYKSVLQVSDAVVRLVDGREQLTLTAPDAAMTTFKLVRMYTRGRSKMLLELRSLAACILRSNWLDLFVHHTALTPSRHVLPL